MYLLVQIMSQALLPLVLGACHCGALLRSDLPHYLFDLLLQALHGLPMPPLRAFGLLSPPTYLLLKLLDALPQALLVSGELHVHVFQLLHTSLQIVEVDLHLMLQADVPTDVCLQLLQHLLVLFRRLRILRGVGPIGAGGGRAVLLEPLHQVIVQLLKKSAGAPGGCQAQVR